MVVKYNILKKLETSQSLRKVDVKEMPVIQPEVPNNVSGLYTQVSKQNVKGMKSNNISSLHIKTSGNKTTIVNSK